MLPLLLLRLQLLPAGGQRGGELTREVLTLCQHGQMIEELECNCRVEQLVYVCSRDGG